MAGRRRKPLLVGQAPSRLTEGLGAFRGRSGKFLASLLGWTLDELLGRVEAVNLLPRFPGKCGKGDAFDPVAARTIAGSVRTGNRLVLLCGKKVASCFGVGGPMAFLERREVGNASFVLLPHPSGVNHWWNDRGNKEAAGGLLRSLLLPTKKPRKKRALPGRSASS